MQENTGRDTDGESISVESSHAGELNEVFIYKDSVKKKKEGKFPDLKSNTGTHRQL